MTRFTKISGTSLDFRSGERLSTGVHYAVSRLDLPNKHIFISTRIPGRTIESDLSLMGSDGLDFSINSDDPSIPTITGRFLNSDFRENIMAASLSAKNINISGSVTKLNESSFVSVKTLTETLSGNVIAVIQELMETISESQYNAAIEKL